MPNIKTKFLTDRTKYIDHSNILPDNNSSMFIGKKSGDTEIVFRKLGTNIEVGRTHNRVVLAGSQFTAMKHFDMPELLALPTYNQDLGLDHSLAHGTTPENSPKICLFCCGTGGCGPENSQVYTERYVGRIHPHTELIPFQYRLPQDDLTAVEREKYFGRKSTNERIAYYFKRFETEPEMHARFVDGTLLDNSAYDSVNRSDAEFYVEMSMRITKEDFRDYFRAVTGINDAKVNSISLLTAWYTQADGYIWYQDIIPMTQLNIPNEPLIDLTKGIDIIYHIYY